MEFFAEIRLKSAPVPLGMSTNNFNTTTNASIHVLHSVLYTYQTRYFLSELFYALSQN